MPVRPPLARAAAGAGLNAVDIAARLAVDPKTVQRWFAGRVPYPRHRAVLAQLTGWSDRDLWPNLAPPVGPDAPTDDVRTTYPHRSAVLLDTWHRLFTRAEHEIGILAYSALFLAEDAAMARLLRAKAQAGVRVRIALGDRTGRHIARRGSDEGVDDVIAARIRHAMALYRPLTDEPGIELRIHDTVLYNSIYRADHELLVNTHVYGQPAAHAPVLHLHRVTDDGMAATYLDSFERVWETAHEPAS
ncbi:MAG: XRE family transcriptional regulator [Dactylosporangium sp.]|nr:XRE family transcriptional regulator [Dactylosporangium sp.]NNJ59725.1 XRE family transcriptional regulator [Dactylosporangium sp.]